MLLYNDKNVFSQKLLSNTASAISKNLPRHAHSTFYFFSSLTLLHLATGSSICILSAPRSRRDCASWLHSFLLSIFAHMLTDCPLPCPVLPIPYRVLPHVLLALLPSVTTVTTVTCCPCKHYTSLSSMRNETTKPECSQGAPWPLTRQKMTERSLWKCHLWRWW